MFNSALIYINKKLWTWSVWWSEEFLRVFKLAFDKRLFWVRLSAVRKMISPEWLEIRERLVWNRRKTAQVRNYHLNCSRCIFCYNTIKTDRSLSKRDDIFTKENRRILDFCKKKIIVLILDPKECLANLNFYFYKNWQIPDMIYHPLWLIELILLNVFHQDCHNTVTLQLV